MYHERAGAFTRTSYLVQFFLFRENVEYAHSLPIGFCTHGFKNDSCGGTFTSNPRRPERSTGYCKTCAGSPRHQQNLDHFTDGSFEPSSPNPVAVGAVLVSPSGIVSEFFGEWVHKQVVDQLLIFSHHPIYWPTAPLLKFGVKAYALKKSWQDRYHPWRDVRGEVIVLGPDRCSSFTTINYYVQSVAAGKYFYTDDVVEPTTLAMPPDPEEPTVFFLNVKLQLLQSVMVCQQEDCAAKLQFRPSGRC